jgi:hypothetical protein
VDIKGRRERVKTVQGQPTFSFWSREQGERLSDELLGSVEATGFQVLLGEVVALLRLVLVAIHHGDGPSHDRAPRNKKINAFSRNSRQTCRKKIASSGTRKPRFEARMIKTQKKISIEHGFLLFIAFQQAIQLSKKRHRC